MSNSDAILADAMQAKQLGNTEKFIKILEELIATSNDTRALNILGNYWLNIGRTDKAVTLLQRAVSADPTAAALWFNLAAAFSKGAQHVMAISALDKALEIDPYFVQAIFQKALAYERLGEKRKAALIFEDFLKCAPDGLDEVAALEPALNHAKAAININREAFKFFANEQLSKLAVPASKANSARFADSFAHFLGDQKLYVQEPTFLNVARLPAIPFFEPDMFPWLDLLKDNWREIQSELQNLLDMEKDNSFQPYVAQRPGLALNQWSELNNSRNWSAFFFWQHGKMHAENCKKCPLTTQLLEKLPLIQLEGRSPNIFFSALQPHTKIPPHTGVSNIRATVHLPLIIPEGCGFRVGSETQTWAEGVPWVFDDTIDHEAWNDSDQPRYILIIDIWNPFLTDMEKVQFSQLLNIYSAYYSDHQGWGADA